MGAGGARRPPRFRSRKGDPPSGRFRWPKLPAAPGRASCEIPIGSLRIGMGLDSREIDVFLAIRRHRSLGRAAAALGLTQPGVSRILRRLEDQVGAQLFERHPSGVLPTQAGDALLPYAEELASNARSALEEIASLRGQGASTVRVGAVASVVSTVLPRVVGRLLNTGPPVRVQLVEGIEDQLSEALAGGAIDLAVAGRMEHSVIPLSKADRFSTTVVAVAGRGHELSGAAHVPLLELARRRGVLPPAGTPWREEFGGLFRRVGVEPPAAVVETRSITAIRALVGLTDLLSWQPRSLICGDASPDPLVEVDAPDLVWRRQFFVFKRRRGVLGQGALRLVKELRAFCRDEGLSTPPVADDPGARGPA